MIDVLTDLAGLKKHVDDSGLAFKDSILDYYEVLGNSQGYEVVKNSSIIDNNIDYGKVDLVWVEPQLAMSLEFGSEKDVLAKIFLNMVLDPEQVLFILSSKSQIKLEKIIEILRNTPQLKKLKDKTIIIDVGKYEKVYP